MPSFVRPSRGLAKARWYPQLFAAAADMKVVFGVKDKVAARKGSVRPLGLIHELHVRLNSPLVHQPPDHLGRAVTRIGDQTRRRDIELLGRAVDHRLGRADFGLANGRRHLDVHDHRVLQIDEVVVGIGITGERARQPMPNTTAKPRI